MSTGAKLVPNIPTVEGIPIPPTTSKDEGSWVRPETADDVNNPASSRWYLKAQASALRSGQYIGMTLHYLASPRPPNPNFTLTIPSLLSKYKGTFTLQFYTPKGYEEAAKHGKRYPAVVNFHGGGFTIGNGTDDARFARYILDTCDAVFVSVDYRLAPEYPFPTAVDDAADALFYIIRQSADLHIDPMKLATSGFSAGGNIAITSTLRFHEHLKEIADPENKTPPVPEHKIRAIATWYPVTDYSVSRAEKRATCVKPEHALPPTMTNLFDGSYLYPGDLKMSHPWLSPARASDEELKEAIPENVLVYTCEWDMLQKEGEAFAKRLAAEPLSKTVHHRMIPGVPHGWDKSPDPLKPAVHTQEVYTDCCRKLLSIFNAVD